MTGSAIAIPLLAAASASAADGTTWDRVAQCESGGAWSSNQGNGYYGGLQLDQATWEAHGGLDYAKTADQASRSQQIAVAEKVLADTGLAAWPTCGPLSGLSKGSGEVSVDTGVAGDSASSDAGSYVSSGLATAPSASASSGSSASGESSTPSTGTPSPSASASSSATGTNTGNSDKTADPSKSGQKEASSSASDDATTGTGRHRGGEASENATGADGSAGRHAATAGSDAVDDSSPDDSYAAKVLGSLWNSSDNLGFENDLGKLTAPDPTAADSGPGLVVPGRSIVVVAETAQ
ncbi:transglycosylase family protein [Streptomyces sp. NPDC059618]|uniref:transglycosylase family protein n=1 Tax=Streptomyces sp. NPDC059618 TaxID=3346887 RepID=UPI00369B8F73